MSKKLFKKPLFWLSAILGGILFFQIASFVSGQTGNPPGDAGQVLKINSGGALVIATTTITNEGVGADLIINPTGNLGIGVFTGAVQEKLQVVGSVMADYFIGNWVGTISSANISSDVFGRTAGMGNFAFPASLGIGTASQNGIQVKLQINDFGSGAPSNDILAINTQTDNPSGILIDNDGNFNVGAVIRHQFVRPDLYSILSLGTRGYSGVEQTLNIKQGNVGIGPTVPLYKLDVGGDVNISGAYRKSGTAGITAACPTGQVLATTTVSGGIVTGGTCVPLGGTAAPTDASYLTLGLNGILTAERVLTAGGGISFSDGGPNGNITITNTGDLSSTNEIQNVISSRGLQRDVSNNFGLMTCPDAYILKYDAGGGGSWYCAVDDTGLPSGTAGQTLRHNGTTWIANSLLYNNGAGIGVGATSLDTNYIITIAGGGIKAKGSTSDNTKYALYAENSISDNLFAVRNDKQIFINNVSYSWPDTQGALNTYLKNDGNGNLAWTTVSGGSGTVTSISAGAGLTATPADPITTAGTINVGVNSTLSTTADTVGINLANPNTWTAAQTFNGGTTAAISCTDCIALTTETSGNYVAGVSSGTGISISGTAIEGWVPTISINTAATLAWSGVHSFSGDTNFPGSGIWKSSGNVGIGTITPGGKLTVYGADLTRLRLQSSQTVGGVDDIGLVFGNSQGAGSTWNQHSAIYLKNAGMKYETYSDHDFQTGSILSSKLIIKGNGNVGIGTADPQSILDVAGQIRISTASNLWLSGGGNIALESGKRVGYSPDTVSFAGVQVASGQLDLFTGNSSRLLINSSGNVGIGTTAPQNKLDVEGSAVIGATYSGTNAGPSNGLLVEGNVGIGTTNPKAKLSVAGNIISAVGYFANGQVSCSGPVEFNDSFFRCNFPQVSTIQFDVGAGDFIDKRNLMTDTASRLGLCLGLGGSGVSNFFTTNYGVIDRFKYASVTYQEWQAASSPIRNTYVDCSY